MTFPRITTGPLWTSRSPRWQQVLRLLPKKTTRVGKNLRSCKPWSQLSVDIFMASGDLLIAQKSKNSKKVFFGTPPGPMPNLYFWMES